MTPCSQHTLKTQNLPTLVAEAALPVGLETVMAAMNTDRGTQLTLDQNSEQQATQVPYVLRYILKVLPLEAAGVWAHQGGHTGDSAVLSQLEALRPCGGKHWSLLCHVVQLPHPLRSGGIRTKPCPPE